MKKNSTLFPYVSAGAIFLFFSLVAYLTLSRPDGGVFSSIGIIIGTLFQLVFFAIGLAIGVALCIAIMLYIYVAAAYLMDRTQGKTVAARTKAAAMEQVRRMLACIAPQTFGVCEPALAASCGDDSCAVAVLKDAPPVNALKDTPPANAAAFSGNVERGALTSNCTAELLQKVDERLAALEATVKSVEAGLAQYARVEQIDAVQVAVQNAADSAKQNMENQVMLIQEKLNAFSGKCDTLDETGKKLDAMSARLAGVEQQVQAMVGLPQEITALREEVNSKVNELPQQIGDMKQELTALQTKLVAVQEQTTKTGSKSRSSKKTGSKQQ